MEKVHSDTPVGVGQKDYGKGVAEVRADDGTKTVHKAAGEESTVSNAVSLKGSVFTLPILKIQQADITAIRQALSEHLSSAPGFFKDSPVVLDLSCVQDWKLEFQQLREMLAVLGMVAVGVQHVSETQAELAQKAGLGLMPAATRAAPKPSNADSLTETPATKQPARRAVAMQTVEPELEETTMVMHQPIRSGQRLYARGGDLIQLAAVNPGAEIMADGNIHIYAPLRGRALAGVSGNEKARIFCHSMEAELVAVAGNYRVFEDSVPSEWYKKSVQIFLQNEQLVIRPIG